MALNISGNFGEINGHNVNLGTIRHIANLKLDDSVLMELYKEDINTGATSLAEIKQKLAQQEDSAEILSILLSLAVDNAKELKLAQIYGTPDLLKFHVALAVLGFSRK